MTQIINSKQKNLGNIIKIQKEDYKKIRSDLTLILEGQKINQKDLRLCFIKLVTQNNELLESNNKLNEQLATVLAELNELKKEHQQKLSRKKARANRKRLPKRDAVTPKIYQALTQATELGTYNSYTAASCTLFIGYHRHSC